MQWKECSHLTFDVPNNLSMSDFSVPWFSLAYYKGGGGMLECLLGVSIGWKEDTGI